MTNKPFKFQTSEPPSTSHLGRELKKLFIIIVGILIVLVCLSVLDQKTGLLTKLAERLVIK